MTQIETTLKQLADLVGGCISGAENIPIKGIASIKDAKADQITFLSGAKNYTLHLQNLAQSKACALIAPEDAPETHLPTIKVKQPYAAFAAVLNFFHPENLPNYKIHPTSFVSENAKVANDVIIGPMAVIEDGAEVGSGTWIKAQAVIASGARVGADCRIHPGVKVLEGSVIKDRCIIHANTVIGSDGFGFTEIDGRQIKVPQVGNVIIEDDVEIGAGVMIDRATMGSTIVGAGTKIDNMVHLAHNVVVGKNCTIVAQVGISGSTILEDNVTMAGQTGTVGHVTIGKGTIVAARGVVTGNVAPGSFVSGFPIKPHGEERRILAASRKLPGLLKRVRALESEIKKKDE